MVARNALKHGGRSAAWSTEKKCLLELMREFSDFREGVIG
jgi:hypothetical protein